MASEIVPTGESRGARSWRVAAWATLFMAATPVEGAQFDIVGPPGSVRFGTSVAVLPNGNIVVTDPDGPVSGIGAVYLYDPNGALISMLTGSTLDDHVGSGGVVVLSNGNYVIRSPSWNNTGATAAGAVTWASGNSGVSGVVTPANSLVGTRANDKIGECDFGTIAGVIPLNNGNYVVQSPQWNTGTANKAGAVTFGNGASGVKGAVSPANSLVGTADNDIVGFGGVYPLANGNYVVGSPFWNNGGTGNTGAATWGNGGAGISGAVGEANSLIGKSVEDQVGSAVTALGNGNYVVTSPLWNNEEVADAGAATWGDGSGGLAGLVTPENSLVGTTPDDRVGFGGVLVLSNGNYVVLSEHWSNDALPAADAGAATWGDGASGAVGPVSAENSLVGTTLADGVGGRSALNGNTGNSVALSNGNYVVASFKWDNGSAVDVGAATWCDGTKSTKFAVSPSNSWIGTTDVDWVGFRLAALSNGNYVVGSAVWDNGPSKNVGAATWVDGGAASNGVVSVANSLIGTTPFDNVGEIVFALENGNYVVESSQWDSVGAVNAGATTWRDGSVATSGVVLPSNSLIGSIDNDMVGRNDITALAGGDYVVASGSWGLGNEGALTWGNGGSGVTGTVGPTNSLVGSAGFDRIGLIAATAFGDGNYASLNSQWANAGTPQSGAVVLARGGAPLTGTITSSNGVLGTVQNGGSSLVFGYDSARERLAVGRPASNIVSLFTLPTNMVFKNGFE